MLSYTKNQTLSDRLRKSKDNVELNLKLTDFGKQSHISSQEIADKLNALPSFHLQNLQEILFDPERFTPQILNDNPYSQIMIDAKGVYIQSQRMVVIFDFTSRAELFHTLFHEIAHHVYFVVISQQLKMDWVKDICRNDRHITDYASRNAAEDFAESYAAYLLNPEELMQIPLKYDFLRKHVFTDVANIMQSDSLDFRA